MWGYIRMNKIKLLGVYKWATMGGVERVLLNRAHAIQQHNLNIKYDVYFFFDSGGKDKFRQYLESNGLTDIMNVVETIESQSYDHVLSIDTPEVFDYVEPEKVHMECHTSYKENRKYLSELDEDIQSILVPSEVFLSDLKSELPSHLAEKLKVMPNSVHVNKSSIDFLKIYNKTPVLYVGRLDKLKNVKELIDIVGTYNRTSDELVLMLAGPIIEHDIDLKKELQKHGIVNRTIYLPPVSFDKVGELLHFVRANEGLFMSASVSESYGLSVAEAMKVGIPVLAYDNDAHRDLLGSDSTFLYKNDLEQACLKIKHIRENYVSCSKQIQKYSALLERDFVEQFLSICS